MNEISIGIRVQRAQLDKAIEDLNRLNAGPTGRNGGATGGLNVAGLDASTRRIATNLQSWQQAAARARSELKQLTADLKGLEQASHSPGLAASTRGVMLAEVAQMEARRREVEKELSRADRRVADYQRRVPATSGNQQLGHSGPDQHSGSGTGSSAWGQVRRVAGWGLAAAGGFSLLGFLSQSRAKYQQTVGHEALLAARGIRGGFGENAGLGIGPLEQMALLEQLSAESGLHGKGASAAARTSALLGRYAGIDPGQVAGLYGSMYGATGAKNAAGDTIGVMSEAFRRGLDKAKATELLGLTTRNTQLTAQAMGGAAMSADQVRMSAAWSSMAMLQKDPALSHFAKSQTFGNILQNGFQGAGNPAGDILLFKALGGLNGPLTLDKLASIEQLREEGPMMHPEILAKLIGSIPGQGAGKNYLMKKMLASWGLTTKSAGDLQKLMGGDTFQQISQLTAAGKGIPKELQDRWQKEAGSLPGMDKLSLSAQKEIVEVKAGAKLNDIFGKFEHGALNFASALEDKNWRAAFDTLGKTIRELGPLGKTLLAAGGLYATGGALSFMGGALSLGKGGIGTATGLLSRLGPLLLNPVTGTAAAIGGAYYGIGKLADVHGKELVESMSDKDLTDRKHQLEVMGGGKGPEYDRITNELKRRGRRPLLFNQYSGTVRAAAAKYHIPENILAGLIESESSWVNHRPRTINLKGGRTTTVAGLAQFSDETAKRYHVDRMDPDSAIEGAGHYLSDLYRTEGSWQGAVRRYKGIASASKMNQADRAFELAGKYDGSASGEQNQLVDLLQQIVAATQATAAGVSGKQQMAVSHR